MGDDGGDVLSEGCELEGDDGGGKDGPREVSPPYEVVTLGRAVNWVGLKVEDVDGFKASFFLQTYFVFELWLLTWEETCLTEEDSGNFDEDGLSEKIIGSLDEEDVKEGSICFWASLDLDFERRWPDEEGLVDVWTMLLSSCH